MEPGSRLGPYEILSAIGAGGMGEVYAARDERVGRTVAIKVLPKSVGRSPDAIERFQREARAAAALSHPNILTLFEFDSSDGVYFAVTELLEGETLRDRLRRGTISWRRAAEIAAEAAEGLAAAHAKGIVHRDIKPDNIFITSEGKVKILDFGLATVQLRENAASATDITAPADPSGSAVGTVGYMAPEQLRGESGSASSDIFALGCTLYEMVAGVKPFARATPVEMMSAVLRDDPPDLATASQRVPVDLERIIRRCLEKMQAARFQSAGDLAFLLRQVAASDPSSDVVTPPPLPRRRIGAVVTGLVLAVTAITAFLLLKDRDPSVTREGVKPIRSLAVLPFTNATSGSDAEYMSDGITDSLINSLSTIEELKVVSRSSVFRYKGKELNPRQVGKELDVEALLTGRVMQPGERLVVSAELTDARTNRHLWGQQFDVEGVDVLSVQEKIAQAISEELRLELSGQQKSALGKRHTENPEAYRLYLQGRYYWNKRTGEAFQRALRFFDEAIAADPAYALPYAGLADTYILQAIFNEAAPRDVLPRAKAAAVRALELDPRLAEAHTSLAYFQMNYDYDLAAAERTFRQAIALNPSYATAHQWLSRCLVQMGRFDEAIAEVRKAQELDPLSQIITVEVAGVYADAGKIEPAIAECRKALEFDSDFPFAHYVIAGALLRSGRAAEAVGEAKQAWEMGKDPRSLVRLGLAYAQAGRREDAVRTHTELQTLSAERVVPHYFAARLALQLGDPRAALDWLEHAEDHEPPKALLAKLTDDPVLEPLRKDPRFVALVERVRSDSGRGS